MITLYTAPTPNGLKIALFLEETRIVHRTVRLHLGEGDQFKPEFLVISPNNKIPAIVDDEPSTGGEPISIFESGAILLYLAEKHRCFLPEDVHSRVEVLQWLFWQMAGLGPMAGQMGYFAVYASERVPYAITRYTNEVKRLYGVLDRCLQGRIYIAHDYSIADMACYPWIVPHLEHGQHFENFPNLKRWFETIAARPATRRAYEGVENIYATCSKSMSNMAREILFRTGISST